MRAFDENLSRRIHALGHRWLDWALLAPGMMFGSYGLPVLIVLLGLWAGWKLAFVATLAAITTVALTGPLKHALGRPRPGPLESPRAFALRSLVDNPSLPSGDSAQAGALTALLVLQGPVEGPARWLFLCLPPLCMFSRVYFGAHWVADTVAGVVIGALVGALYAGWFSAWLA